MYPRSSVIIAALLLTTSHSAQAADAAAGKAAAAACAACHGINGVSIAATIPNLAAQKPKYIEGQLKAFKSERRKHPIMGPIAKQLSFDAMANLAAYFSGLPGPAPGGSSLANAKINQTRVSFPVNYKTSFTPYYVANNERRKQVRVYFANKIAVDAARAGEKMPNGAVFFTEVYKAAKGPDGKLIKGDGGLYEKGPLILHTAMAKGAGWGDDIPELFRNDGWNYALFSTKGELRTKGFNHAACLGCHLPLKSKSYVFTLDKLIAKVK